MSHTAKAVIVNGSLFFALWICSSSFEFAELLGPSFVKKNLGWFKRYFAKHHTAATPSPIPFYQQNGGFFREEGEEPGAGGQALWGAPGQAAEAWLPEDWRGNPGHEGASGGGEASTGQWSFFGLGFLVDLQEANLLLLDLGLPKELGHLLLVLLPVCRRRCHSNKTEAGHSDWNTGVRDLENIGLRLGHGCVVRFCWF